MWEAFLFLLRESLISAKALIYLMDLHTPTTGTYTVSRILRCFQFFIHQSLEEL